MGWSRNLLTGAAALLADGGAGTWRPDGTAYQPNETAIVLSQMPPAPDRVICLRLYPVSIDDGHGDVTVGLQVRTRAGADPREVLDLADDVYQLLDGLMSVRLGGVWVSQIYRRSGEELGADAGADRQGDRMERVDNYYVQASRPSPHRTP
jgi:hypothetical protein